MSDFSVNDDLLLQQQNLEIEAGVNKARQQIATTRKTGKCLFCDEVLEVPEASYCDTYCREDHAKELHNKMVQGIR